MTAPVSPPGLWKLLFRQRRLRIAGGILALLAGLALTADLLASDKPLVARYHGELYLLACLTDPAGLRQHSVQTMLHSMAEGDWLIAPPVPWGPNEQDKGHMALASPDRRHLLGTDVARCDVLARLIHGTRVTLVVAIVSVTAYVTLGTLLGLLAGYLGGWVDACISRLTEALITVPFSFLVLAVMGVVEQAGLGVLILAIALVYWIRIARLVRAEAMRLRQVEFIQAAEVLGYSPWRIMVRHLLPNLAAPIFVTTSFGVAGAVLLEAGLSFLGFGTPDEIPSWGGLLRGAMDNFHAWWLVLFPGAMIFATVMACNVAGEALRDVLDPRLAERESH